MNWNHVQLRNQKNGTSDRQSSFQKSHEVGWLHTRAGYWGWFLVWHFLGSKVSENVLDFLDAQWCPGFSAILDRSAPGYNSWVDRFEPAAAEKMVGRGFKVCKPLHFLPPRFGGNSSKSNFDRVGGLENGSFISPIFGVFQQNTGELPPPIYWYLLQISDFVRELSLHTPESPPFLMLHPHLLGPCGSFLLVIPRVPVIPISPKRHGWNLKRNASPVNKPETRW